ncbi:MAG: hypothetical protein IT352_00820 [Gemmatimonadales bacterium]|nr:hypothetical protein [Gemmatimonadales bacterium]
MTVDALVTDLVEAGAGRLEAVIRTEMPGSADRALRWLRGLTGSGRLADYFLHPTRFPMVRLPVWAIEAEAPSHRALVGDTIYSTMAGYYHIRLLDDVMDRMPEAPLELLPLAGLFHLEFQSAYQPHFPADSPFWSVFRTRWLRLADWTVPRPAGTAADGTAPRPEGDGVLGTALPTDPDAGEALLERAGATVGAVVIPLRALTLGVGAPDRFVRWEPVVLALARVEQWIDDVVDWQQDLDRGQPNLLLAAGATRARPGEATAVWVVREGYRWGLATARARLDELEPAARSLASAPLAAFLDRRRAALAALMARTEAGLDQLAALARSFPTSSA